MKEILKEIIPSKEEIKKTNSLVKELLKKIKIKDTSIIPGGSFAKDTWLKNNHDIDIYVAFNYEKYKNKNISQVLEKSLKKNFKKIKKIKGSRNYFQIKKNNYIFEIIPILKIKNVKQAKNIMDISPFHVKWVKKHKKSNEIRLAKAFFKASNCYGAESYIKGFSGYVVEILTIYYKTFYNLVKKASKWKKTEKIDFENHSVELNKSKLSSLILIDPIQSDRNAAAALSMEKYNLFIESSKSYLKNPSKDFFIEKQLNIKELKKKSGKNNLILIEALPKKSRNDIMGCKILKTFEYIKKQLLSNDFKILENGWNWDKKAILWYIIKKQKLPEYTLHTGPKLNLKEHLERFMKKHKKHKFIRKNKRIYAKLPRKHKKPNDLIKYMIKHDKNLKKYIKQLKIIK